MPYIKKENRYKYDKIVDLLPEIENKGDLEYIIFKVMKQYIKNKAFKYSVLHDATYATMHCADEFRRRFLDKRENESLNTNGYIF